MILLKNGTFIDWQTLEFRQQDILVKEGIDGKSIHPSPGGEGPGVRLDKTLDCTGKFITKSFANGHHHAYSALACGMPPPRKDPENFNEILQYIWWNLDKALDIDIIRSSALVTAMACAKNGVTFVIDDHASPFAIDGSLETIAQAFDEVGVSHLLCYEISDRDGLEIAEKGLAETEAYLSIRKGLVGLHASFTVGENTLRQAVELAGQTKSGIHIHVAEAQSDQDHCVRHYGKRVVQRLADAGALQFQKTILAHCLHLDDTERGLVEGSPAWVVQNMESNLNNSVGFFNSEGLGPGIMMGTDGMHSDMLRSAKAAFFAGHNFDNIDYPGIYRRFRNVHHYLDSNGFKGDGDNNLVILDYNSPTPFSQLNFHGHFLFGLEARNICHVISNGELIIENRNLVKVNESEILVEARNQASRLWERMK
jgi:cytosine/adenosine deaminase-related metal-dependent hydrolase